ncbi:inner nuclear membrane protein enriched at telomere/subtelomere region [Recurvomyces mirabilis]|nr:inner nuclear membrane protein enriched at telomere/subtelomere region [Recurvomyces mirabilis]
MEDDDYIKPGFDPATLTMPKLRSILVAHGVNYPSSAKKGQLVELFNETVLPQARSIRAANARVRRTSRGIEDVASSQGTANEDEEEDEAVPVRPATVTRASRRSTRARTEEPEEVAPTPRAARHSTAPLEDQPGRASVKHARAVPELQEEPQSKRAAPVGSRQSAVTPATKREPRDDEGPFSADNVFQSGSSPPPPSRSRDTESRRTTMTTARSTERRASRDRRRVTENIRPVREQRDGATVPTRRTFDMPVTRVKKEEEAVLQPTEEFTPEEHNEVVQAEQSGGLVPVPRRSRRPASTAVKTGPAAVITALLVGVAALWRQEKLEVGYCGVGSPSTDIAGVEIPQWAEVARPQCELCPQHAYCGDKLSTECEPGFVLTHHPLSLGGLVPLPPSCEPDSAKARKVNAVKERAVEQLREQNAKYECGEAPKPELKEPELKSKIIASKRKSMSNEEFEDLWAAAIPEIQGTDEVISGADGSGHSTLRSSSLARLPLTCAVRRSLRETLRRYFWQVVGLLLLASSGTYGRYRITSGRATEQKAKVLASRALELLSQQAALHAYDPDSYGENYMSVAQLRDDVLRDEFSASRRKILWERVQRKVEGNSNVRPMVREGRTGDVGRVWEWVGAVGLIEGSTPSTVEKSGRRKSVNRVSFGGVTGERLIEDRGETSAKWEEGRQYY